MLWKAPTVSLRGKAPIAAAVLLTLATQAFPVIGAGGAIGFERRAKQRAGIAIGGAKAGFIPSASTSGGVGHAGAIRTVSSIDTIAVVATGLANGGCGDTNAIAAIKVVLHPAP